MSNSIREFLTKVFNILKYRAIIEQIEDIETGGSVTLEFRIYALIRPTIPMGAFEYF